MRDVHSRGRAQDPRPALGVWAAAASLGVVGLGLMVVGLLGGFRAAGAGASEPLSPLEHRGLALASTARVAVRGCDGVRAGSGFVTGGVFVTNRHVVAGALDAKIELPEGPVFRPVHRRARGVDLAVLGPLSLPSLPLAERDAPIGTVVRYAGHGADGVARVEQATVHLHVDGEAYGAAGPVLLLDGPAAPGYSGAPVIDELGQVVGVLQGYDERSRLSLAVPVSTLGAWLEHPGVGDLPGPGPICADTG